MKQLTIYIQLFGVILLLSSCGHNVSNETTVYEDGTVDKTFVFYQRDGNVGESRKMFRLSPATGWKERKNSLENSGNDSAFQIMYSKTFPSVDVMNLEFAQVSDSTFQVTSTFEKKFRWFYTYLYYSETYHPINKLKLPINQYITPEDSAFVERLPGEGQLISHADSIYLTQLNNKLFDQYATDAIMDEYMKIALEVMQSQNIEKRWVDTLQQHRDMMTKLVLSQDTSNSVAPIILKYMDNLGIPLDYSAAKTEFQKRSTSLDTRITFMSWAAEGTYRNIFNMPWEVTATNADSVSGNRLVFSPPTIKFLFKPYTMHATSRRMNYWAVIATIALAGFTIFLYIRSNLRK